MRYLFRPLLLLAAGSAPAATRDWPVANFDRVDLAAAASVEVRTGQRFALHADGDPELVARLDPIVSNGTLAIRWRPAEKRISIRNQRVHLIVAMPRIAGATISGAGTMTVGRVQGASFDANISGAGDLKVPAVAVGRLGLAVRGAGSITAAGQAQQLDARVMGVGSIEAPRLVARAAHVEMGGTGSIDARVDGPVEGSVSGLGSITVRGQARCSIRRSGLGSVSCGR
jgi:hypothetical protein